MVSGMGYQNKELSNGKFEIKLVVSNLGVFILMAKIITFSYSACIQV